MTNDKPRRLAARDLQKGDVLRFRAPWASDRYGATATVVAIGWAIAVPGHPGHVTTCLVDLVTANGTELQWPAGTVTSRLAR